jgi:hypothetical protein
MQTMKRRAILTGALAALTGGPVGGQQTKKRTAPRGKKALTARTRPDSRLEAHQIALVLLLLDDSNNNDNQKYFTAHRSYDRGSIFDVNGIDQGVYGKVRSVYVDDQGHTTRYWGELRSALGGLRTQMKYMGGAVQPAAQPYMPGNPCPYHDAMSKKAPAVQKLTK